MQIELSAAAETYIARAIADGAYASRAAVLEAAVAVLREKHGGGRQAAVAEAYGTVALTPEECARLQRIAEGAESPDDSEI